MNHLSVNTLIHQQISLHHLPYFQDRNVNSQGIRELGSSAHFYPLRYAYFECDENFFIRKSLEYLKLKMMKGNSFFLINYNYLLLISYNIHI